MKQKYKTKTSKMASIIFVIYKSVVVVNVGDAVYDLEMREPGYNLKEMNDRQALYTQKTISEYTKLDDRSFLLM